jgi:lipoprotein signal peptidase
MSAACFCKRLAMSWSAFVPCGPDEIVGRPGLPSSRQRRYFVWIFVVVAVADQVTKWWAWRNVASVWVNSGGDVFTSSRIGSIFNDPAAGAVIDVFGATLLACSAYLLLSRRRRTGVLIGGSLVIAGWSSNVLDRLGTHHWTAPGSVRGAVDFIVVRVGAVFGSPELWNMNVADIGIGAGAFTLLGAAMATMFGRSGYRHWPALQRAYWQRTGRLRRFVPVLVGTSCVIAFAVAGSTQGGGTHEPDSRGLTVAVVNR